VIYGSKVTTSGGQALKFYASIRLEIRRIGAVKDGEEHVGNRTVVKVVKNKVAPPFRQAEFEIIYGKGINHEGELLDCGLALGLIKKSGTWLSIDETQLGQGRKNACQHLAENAELSERLLAAVTLARERHPAEAAVKPADKAA